MRPEAPVAVAIALLGVCLILVTLGAYNDEWATVAGNIAVAIGAVGVFAIILMLVKEHINL